MVLKKDNIKNIIMKSTSSFVKVKLQVHIANKQKMKKNNVLFDIP